MRTALLTFLCTSIAGISQLMATPTNVFWTNCTTDVVHKDQLHLDVDNYFSTGHPHSRHRPNELATDIGLEYGVLSWSHLRGEIGIDYLTGVHDPLYFNGKLSIEEGKLFDTGGKYLDLSPSLSVGMFNIGTSKHTNESVFDLVLGTTLPKKYGRAFVGFFHGKRALGKHRTGIMLAYEKGFYLYKDKFDREYHKWKFVADYASGKNKIGGGGFGIAYYITPHIYAQAGPVWFSDKRANGKWKWSLQLDVDLM